MSLSIDIYHSFGEFSLHVAFEASGGVTALFGTSGAGKTTVVNAVAGLLTPQAGRITVGGRTLLDTRGGVNVPVHQRRLGYVFQDGRLFPHLTVQQNLTYPARFQADPAKPADVDQIVELLGIGAILTRRPATLSGGEKQRVAIGRALLSKPAALLLDEPLAALDLERRAEVLPFLARLRDESDLPILYVSHARSEVRALADHVVVMTSGTVTADGPVGEVLGRGGAGSTVGIPVAGQSPADSGFVRLETAAGPLFSLAERVPATGARSVTIVASDIVLTSAPRESLASQNVLDVVTGDFRKAGPGMTEVPLKTGAATLIARLPIAEAARLRLAPGQSVRAVIARFTVA